MGTSGQDNTTGTRLFLVDHMCVLPYGHNLNLLVLFKKAFASHFGSIVCLVGRDLPEYVEQGKTMMRELPYPYSGTIDRSTGKEDTRTSATRTRLLRITKRIAYTGIHELTKIDLVRARTRRNWKVLYKRFAIGASDSIFFPSSDFYGCLSLLDLVKSLPKRERPKIHLRLIGVLENVHYALSPARPVFFKAIRAAIAEGVDLTLSAETPAYAQYVEHLVGVSVIYLPHPPGTPPQPPNWGRVKVIASPGQGRNDKGFYRLFPIISRLEKNHPGSFRYDVQTMRKNDRDYRPRYISMLSNVPNLVLRPARLRQNEIDAVYAEADILLLPYDSETYALRGSAIYQEGIAVGRPVVCSAGLGFSDLVLRYGNGVLANGDDDFAAKISMLAAQPKAEVERMTERARRYYEQDFNDGLAGVLEKFAQ